MFNLNYNVFCNVWRRLEKSGICYVVMFIVYNTEFRLAPCK